MARPRAATTSQTPSERRRALSRRRHERIELRECPAKTQRVGALPLIGRKVDGIMINVSEGGLLLTLPKRLEPGTRLKFSAEIPQFRDSIEGEVEVRWCLPLGNAFAVGAEFMSMPRGQVAKIQQLRRVTMSKEYRQKHATKAREQRELRGDNNKLELK